MHESSYVLMESNVEEFLKGKGGLSVLDLGSKDVMAGTEKWGSYKPIFTNLGLEYTGLDLEEGNNVDVVLKDPYKFPFEDNSFDVVISGQAFEHVEFFWMTMKEIERVLKVGGYVIIIAPSRGPEHRYPVDCWRFYPDGMRALGKYVGLEVLKAETDWGKKKSTISKIVQYFSIKFKMKNSLTTEDSWGNTIGIFKKSK